MIGVLEDIAEFIDLEPQFGDIFVRSVNFILDTIWEVGVKEEKDLAFRLLDSRVIANCAFREVSRLTIEVGEIEEARSLHNASQDHFSWKIQVYHHFYKSTHTGFYHLGVQKALLAVSHPKYQKGVQDISWELVSQRDQNREDLVF